MVQTDMSHARNSSPFKVTVDSQAVWPPVSRYGFRIEDTGHMYIIRTPSHIQIQWLHSSGLMILEASKTSKAQGRGLCGEVGPSWGRAVLPWLLSGTRKVPLYQDKLGQGIRPEVGPTELPVWEGLMSLSGAEAVSRE